MFYADKFRISCSSISKIMAEIKPAFSEAEERELQDLILCEKGELLTPTGKVAGFTTKRKERLAELKDKKDNPPAVELPDGAKTVCKDYVRSKVFKRRKGFTSKSTEKGTRTEENGIELLRQYEDDEFLEKNEWRVIGEYIEGECDILAPSVLYDIKSVETPFTLPVWNLNPSRGYWCQLQGYGYLYSRKKLVLAYTLNNMPEDMIEREARIKCRTKYGTDYTYDEYAEVLEKTTYNKTYDDLPLAMRVRTIAFDYDHAFIDSVIERVKMCRAYIAKLEEALPEDIKIELYNRFKQAGKVCRFKPYSKNLPQGAQNERA